jgi:hypothetical protein
MNLEFAWVILTWNITCCCCKQSKKYFLSSLISSCILASSNSCLFGRWEHELRDDGLILWDLTSHKSIYSLKSVYLQVFRKVFLVHDHFRRVCTSDKSITLSRWWRRCRVGQGGAEGQGVLVEALRGRGDGTLMQWWWLDDGPAANGGGMELLQGGGEWWWRARAARKASIAGEGEQGNVRRWAGMTHRNND